MLVYRKLECTCTSLARTLVDAEGKNSPFIFSPEHILGPRRGLMFFLRPAGSRRLPLVSGLPREIRNRFARSGKHAASS